MDILGKGRNTERIPSILTHSDLNLEVNLFSQLELSDQ